MIRLLTDVLLLLSSVVHAAPQLWVVYKKNGVGGTYLSCSTEKTTENVGNPTKTVIVPCISGISGGYSETMPQNLATSAAVGATNLRVGANNSFDMRGCYSKSTGSSIVAGSVTDVDSPFDTSDMLYRLLDNCPKYSIVLYDTSFNYAVCNSNLAQLNGDSNLIECDTATYGTGTSILSIVSKLGEYLPVTTKPVFKYHYEGDTTAAATDGWPVITTTHVVTRSANLANPSRPPSDFVTDSNTIWNVTVVPGCVNNLQPQWFGVYVNSVGLEQPQHIAPGVASDLWLMYPNACQWNDKNGNVELIAGSRVSVQVTTKPDTGGTTMRQLNVVQIGNPFDGSITPFYGTTMRYWISTSSSSSYDSTAVGCRRTVNRVPRYGVTYYPIMSGAALPIYPSDPLCSMSANTTYYINIETKSSTRDRVLIHLYPSEFK